jgi:hypothetical protein
MARVSHQGRGIKPWQVQFSTRALEDERQTQLLKEA